MERSEREKSDAPAPLVPCRLLLTAVPAARVIGKGGESVRRIREQSSANVRVLQRELPDSLQRREEHVILISGPTESVRLGLDGVLARVFDRSGLPESQRGEERPHIIEVLVPEKSGSHLVGQRGERVRSLIEETGCDVDIVKGTVQGLLEQKRVRVSGSSVGEVTGAVWRVQEVLAELAASGVLKPEHFELREEPGSTGFSSSGGGASGGSRGSDQREVPTRLLLSKEEAAWMVGKRGNKIAKLRAIAKVQVNDADAPPFDPTERVGEISGAPVAARVLVVQHILEDLAQRQEALDVSRLLVPTEHFGSVMGHRGETIREVINRSGANLQQHKAEKLDNGEEYRFRLVEIAGEVSARIAAVQMICQALEPDRGSPHRSVSSGASSPGVGITYAPSMSHLTNGGADFGVPAALPIHSDASLELGGQLSLQLAVPSAEIAQFLASDASGIARRAGISLSAGTGPKGMPVVQITGTAVANAVACYLIQDRLFLMH